MFDWFLLSRRLGLNPFSSPEAALFLVSTKNRDLWPGPTTFRLNGFANTIYWDHNQSDLSDLTLTVRRVTASPWIADFRCWTWTEVAILGADQKERSLWGREWDSPWPSFPPPEFSPYRGRKERRVQRPAPSLTLLSLWLKTVVYLQTSTQNYRQVPSTLFMLHTKSHSFQSGTPSTTSLFYRRYGGYNRNFVTKQIRRTSDIPRRLTLQTKDVNKPKVKTYIIYNYI